MGPHASRKATVGQDHLFWYWPDKLPSTTPSLTVRLSAVDAAASDVTVSLTQLRDEVAISSVGTDRLTLSTGSSLSTTTGGLILEHGGRAFLDDDRFGLYPVRIARVGGDTIWLAEPLPQDISGATPAGARLVWNAWYTTLSSANVTASVRRSVPWVVTHSVQMGDDMPVEPVTVGGVLHVVRQPFDTGLADEGLYRVFPGLSMMVPRGQSSFASQRWEAQAELEEMLLAEGLDPDNLRSAHQLQGVHALLTAATLLQGHHAEGIDRERQVAMFREDAYRRFGNVLKSLQWYDADDDGTVDDGEADRQVGGVLSSMFGAYEDTRRTSDGPRFAVGEEH